LEIWGQSWFKEMSFIPSAKNARKSLNERPNFYEKTRTSRDGRFSSDQFLLTNFKALINPFVGRKTSLFINTEVLLLLEPSYICTCGCICPHLNKYIDLVINSRILLYMHLGRSPCNSLRASILTSSSSIMFFFSNMFFFHISKLAQLCCLYTFLLMLS
jgi:hypothetical protein